MALGGGLLYWLATSHITACSIEQLHHNISHVVHTYMLFVREESRLWRPYPDLLRSPVEEAAPFFRRMQQVAVWPPVTSGSRLTCSFFRKTRN